MIYQTFAFCILMLGGLDAITTTLALQAGHIEANPLISSLIDWLGSWWMVPKIVFHLLIAYLLLYRQTRKALINAGVVCAGYTAIVVSNLVILL